MKRRGILNAVMFACKITMLQTKHCELSCQTSFLLLVVSEAGGPGNRFFTRNGWRQGVSEHKLM